MSKLTESIDRNIENGELEITDVLKEVFPEDYEIILEYIDAH